MEQVYCPYVNDAEYKIWNHKMLYRQQQFEAEIKQQGEKYHYTSYRDKHMNEQLNRNMSYWITYPGNGLLVNVLFEIQERIKDKYRGPRRNILAQFYISMNDLWIKEDKNPYLRRFITACRRFGRDLLGEFSPEQHHKAYMKGKDTNILGFNVANNKDQEWILLVNCGEDDFCVQFCSEDDKDDWCLTSTLNNEVCWICDGVPIEWGQMFIWLADLVGKLTTKKIYQQYLTQIKSDELREKRKKVQQSVIDEKRADREFLMAERKKKRNKNRRKKKTQNKNKNMNMIE